MKIQTVAVRCDLSCDGGHGHTDSNEESELLAHINRYRALRGLVSLGWSFPLTIAARAHSAAMGRRGFFDHLDHQGRGPAERVRASGFGPYLIVGENIAAGQRTPAETLAAWIGSPPHHALLVNRIITHAGVGLAEWAGRRYWTLECARPLPVLRRLGDR